MKRQIFETLYVNKINCPDFKISYIKNDTHYIKILNFDNISLSNHGIYSSDIGFIEFFNITNVYCEMINGDFMDIYFNLGVEN